MCIKRERTKKEKQVRTREAPYDLSIVKNLYTIRVFADVGDEGFLNLVAFASGDTEEKVIERGTS